MNLPLSFHPGPFPSLTGLSVSLVLRLDPVLGPRTGDWTTKQILRRRLGRWRFVEDGSGSGHGYPDGPSPYT